jgi:hypothetical protein
MPEGVDPASPVLSEGITGFSRGLVWGYARGGPHTEWGCSVHAGGMRGGYWSCKSSRNEPSSKRLEPLVKVAGASHLFKTTCLRSQGPGVRHAGLMPPPGLHEKRRKSAAIGPGRGEEGLLER